MAKKPKKPPVQRGTTYSLNASGEVRFEFVVSLEWAKELDTMAESFGLSRSAYIRLACNRQMDSDRRSRQSS